MSSKNTKRIVTRMLCAFVFCSILISSSVSAISAARTGDTLGWVLYTDIVAYIDGKPIRSYNIEGNTYIVVEDLMEYGFSVTWNPGAGRLVIGSKNGNITSDYIPAKNTHKAGEPAMPYLYTEITTWIGSTQVVGYNIGGYTCVCMDDLAKFYAKEYVWNPEDLSLRMNTYVSSEKSETHVYNPTDKTTETTEENTKKVMTAEEIYAVCSPAVFYIEGYDENKKYMCSGSGFFIDESGIAVTNYHVINGVSYALIRLSDTREIFKVDCVYDFDAGEDWAVIKVDGDNFPYLSRADSSDIVGGASVYAIGCPLGLENTISEGIISNPSRVLDGETLIQTTAAISHGSSGGALINKYGEVIGVTSSSLTNGDSLNFAVPISAIDGYNKQKIMTLKEMTEIKPALSYVVLDSWINDHVNVDLFGSGKNDSYLYRYDDSNALYMSTGELNGNPAILFQRIITTGSLDAIVEIVLPYNQDYIFTSMRIIDTKYNEDVFYGESNVKQGCFSNYAFQEKNTYGKYFPQKDVNTFQSIVLVSIHEMITVLEAEMNDYTDKDGVDWMFDQLGFGELIW